MHRGLRFAEIVIAAACWGIGTVAMKIAVGGLAPMTALFVQLVSATAVVWVVFAFRGVHAPKGVWRLALIGVFEPGLTYAAVDLGLLHTSAANASLLSGTESVFVVLLAMLFLRERPGVIALVAVGVGVVGIGVLSGSAPTWAASLGDALVLCGSLAAAIYVTLASTIAPDADAVAMTAYQFLAGTIVGVPFVAVQWAVSGTVVTSDATPKAWLAAVAAGVIGLAASFLLYNHAIATINVTVAGMVLNLIPVFGLLAAFVVLREKLHLWEIVGAVIVLISLVVFAADEARQLRTTTRSQPRTPA